MFIDFNEALCNNGKTIIERHKMIIRSPWHLQTDCITVSNWTICFSFFSLFFYRVVIFVCLFVLFDANWSRAKTNVRVVENKTKWQNATYATRMKECIWEGKMFAFIWIGIFAADGIFELNQERVFVRVHVCIEWRGVLNALIIAILKHMARKSWPDDVQLIRSNGGVINHKQIGDIPSIPRSVHRNTSNSILRFVDINSEN